MFYNKLIRDRASSPGKEELMNILWYVSIYASFLGGSLLLIKQAEIRKLKAQLAAQPRQEIYPRKSRKVEA